MSYWEVIESRDTRCLLLACISSACADHARIGLMEGATCAVRPGGEPPRPFQDLFPRYPGAGHRGLPGRGRKARRQRRDASSEPATGKTEGGEAVDHFLPIESSFLVEPALLVQRADGPAGPEPLCSPPPSSRPPVCHRNRAASWAIGPADYVEPEQRAPTATTC
jgi:hypothetical protein